MLSLAPDASSREAAQGVAEPGRWQARGVTGQTLYGECEGSGTSRYRTCADLGESAYRCTCPSRKIPCKHTLGLLLLWSAGDVPESAALPAWAAQWQAARAARAARADGADGADRPPGAGARSAPGASREEGSQRHARVAAGLAELERWLADQTRQGLAAATASDWEGVAKRLIDAQAPGVASMVTRLARVREEDEWPGRLLEEYALIHLLAVAYRRRAELPPPLAETVLMRVGFPVTREEVLARPTVRDRWDVLGTRDEEQDRLTARRVWLRGRETGRPALVLTFTPAGQPLDASLVTGTTIDADLAFYPGAAPLRALVAHRHHEEAVTEPGPPPGTSVDDALAEVAEAIRADPWTESWPVVLTGVVPGEDELAGFPLLASWRAVWRLLAVSGGRPVTVAAEWTPRGLRPLTTWDEDGTVVIL